MQSKFSHNAVKMQSKCSQNAIKMQPKCSQNSVSSWSAYRLKSFQSCLNKTFIFILDCMTDIYGVRKLPVISNFQPNLIVTVLMTTPVGKLVRKLFKKISSSFFYGPFFAAGRFDEDGSFIGQYGTLQRRQQEQLLQKQMQQQELGIKQGGGTYV